MCLDTLLLRWVNECNPDELDNINWLRIELMANLDPKWGTNIQDQVNRTKSWEALVNILQKTVCVKYPLTSVWMWAVHDKQLPEQDVNQHYQKS